MAVRPESPPDEPPPEYPPPDDTPLEPVELVPELPLLPPDEELPLLPEPATAGTGTGSRFLICVYPRPLTTRPSGEGSVGGATPDDPLPTSNQPG
jgi:hypothetical protein